MAKNGQNDIIFGKLVTSNDFKRPMEDFLKILIFGRFFHFFGSKTVISPHLLSPIVVFRPNQHEVVRLSVDSLLSSDDSLCVSWLGGRFWLVVFCSSIDEMGL